MYNGRIITVAQNNIGNIIPERKNNKTGNINGKINNKMAFSTDKQEDLGITKKKKKKKKTSKVKW